MLLVDKYKLFIFDFDGTLSTSTFLAQITRYLKRRYDLAYVMEHEKEYRAAWKSPDHKWGMDDFYSNLYDQYSKVFRPKLMPHSLDVLDYLNKKHKMTAIFSDANVYRLMSEARMLDLVGRVSLVQSSQPLKYLKPNPAGLLLIAQKFHVPKSSCLYIGDMATDALTARFGNMDSCIIYNGVDSYEKVRKASPTYMFKDLLAFMKALPKSINN